MKIRILIASVSIIALSWLGMSFVTEPDPWEVYDLPLGAEVTVSAEHPDSHRLGELIKEEVDLPAWETGAAGFDLALVD